MQSLEASTPPTSKTKSIKTPLLTPCRQLGLARKSPATSGSWHAPKSSPIVSPSEHHNENKLAPIKTVSGDSIQAVHNQVTPKRSSMGLIRGTRALKMLKTSHLSLKENNDMSRSQLVPKFKTPELTPAVQLQSNKGMFTEHDPLPEDSLCASIVTKSMVEEVRMRVYKKEEELKDLKLAQIYKKKNDVNTLEVLIDKWCEGCQNALLELKSLLDLQEHRMSMGQLLDHLRIPHRLVHYKADVDDFD